MKVDCSQIVADLHVRDKMHVQWVLVKLLWKSNDELSVIVKLEFGMSFLKSVGDPPFHK